MQTFSSNVYSWTKIYIGQGYGRVHPPVSGTLKGMVRNPHYGGHDVLGISLILDVSFISRLDLCIETKMATKHGVSQIPDSNILPILISQFHRSFLQFLQWNVLNEIDV